MMSHRFENSRSATFCWSMAVATWPDVIVAFLGMVAQGDVVAQVMTFTMF